MSGATERVGADRAIAAIPPGARVLLPHGCVEPCALFDAIGRSEGDRRDPPILYTGLHFGAYGFLGAGLSEGDPQAGGLGPGYRFITWQVGPRVRKAMKTGRIGLLPARFRDLPRLFGIGGRLAVDVAVIQCTPPRDGRVSLGISCSLFPAALAAARLVIAEIHPDMPWTSGAAEVPAARIDLAVDATAPLCTLEPVVPDAVDRAIVENVLGLLPSKPWVQLGVGAIPDAILVRLGEIEGVNLHSGMLSEGLADFLAAAGPGARVVTGELAGSQSMYEQAARDSRVVLQPTTVVHDVPYIASLERFVSINSAIEVDLSGQVNGEAIDGVQVSGVGGSLDFVEGARYSPGGMSVIALRSTARGRSRIVPRLREGTPVTVPRFAADIVVTEHGIARLEGLDLEARAAALAAIAAPEARHGLLAAGLEESSGS